MIDYLLGMSESDLVAEGMLIIERRPNSITYKPTQKYKDAMTMPFPKSQTVVYETSKGRFLKVGDDVKLLGMGNEPQISIHEGFIED